MNPVHWNYPPFHWNNPIRAAAIKGASGLTVTDTGTTTGDGDALATVSFSPNEVEAGDIIRVKYLYEATKTADDITLRVWIGDNGFTPGSGNRIATVTFATGGTDQNTGAVRDIYITDATTATIFTNASVSAVGNSGSASTALTIDITAGIDVVFGYSCAGACTVKLHGYTVEYIKSA